MKQTIEAILQRMSAEDIIIHCYDHLPKLYDQLPPESDRPGLIGRVMAYIGAKPKRLTRFAKSLGLTDNHPPATAPTINQTAKGKKVGQTVYGDINF